MNDTLAKYRCGNYLRDPLRRRSQRKTGDKVDRFIKYKSTADVRETDADIYTILGDENMLILVLAMSHVNYFSWDFLVGRISKNHL